MNSLQIHTSYFLQKHPSPVLYTYEKAVVVIIWLKTGKLFLRYYPDTGQEEDESGEEGNPTPPTPIPKTHTHTHMQIHISPFPG